MLRNQESGKYYARLFVKGKEVWKSLKTAHFSVAEARLAASQKEHRESRGKEVDTSNAKMTFGEAASLHMSQVNDDAGRKRRTREYWAEVNKALPKSWPGLTDTVESDHPEQAYRNSVLEHFLKFRSRVAAITWVAVGESANGRKD